MRQNPGWIYYLQELLGLRASTLNTSSFIRPAGDAPGRHPRLLSASAHAAPHQVAKFHSLKLHYFICDFFFHKA